MTQTRPELEMVAIRRRGPCLGFFGLRLRDRTRGAGNIFPRTQHRTRIFQTPHRFQTMRFDNCFPRSPALTWAPFAVTLLKLDGGIPTGLAVKVVKKAAFTVAPVPPSPS